MYWGRQEFREIQRKICRGAAGAEIFRNLPPDKLGTVHMAPGLAPGHYRWTQTVPDLNCLAIFGPSPPQPRRTARRARFDMLARPNYVRGVKSTKFAIAGAKRKNEMLSKFVTHYSKLWPRNFLWQPFETLAYPNVCPVCVPAPPGVFLPVTG